MERSVGEVTVAQGKVHPRVTEGWVDGVRMYTGRCKPQV